MVVGIGVVEDLGLVEDFGVEVDEVDVVGARGFDNVVVVCKTG